MARVKGVYIELDSGLAHNIPVSLKHKIVDTIRARSFIRPEGEQCSLNLLKSGSTIK